MTKLTLRQFQSKGGQARAKRLTKKQRKDIARLGGLAARKQTAARRGLARKK
jgi:hypothetical protein